ncbi:Alpha-galactosidase A precursor [Sphingobacterium spiritivorum]|uniref:Alpha-galactosidase n=1 Tax=Sphingobacterium spiritivorum TaxID=258 RepID=A0A380CTQ3_SPHSI|nr:glycoside hydrolase family 27 protein [Sphingobacterium spiritivorum]SUJ27382.1 Alpha-galactosidase A precursor [Sphingobacterium spiritivorum]
MKLKFSSIAILLFVFQLNMLNSSGQSVKAPIMGWSSWNSFRIHIDEKLIKEQADALISSGLYNAGYRYINVDDGYFGGRDKDGKLFVDSTKFPNGMGAVADYIHSKGLKAGLYSEGGKNTCGSIWDNDTKGIGVGMYGHEKQDAELFFKEWNFDFIKVDWCGGKEMNLNEEEQYTKIVHAVKEAKPDAGFNLCRWQFPGEWALKLVDSWRISEDIRNNFASVLHIIDLNRDMYTYASPGHYNDMDMLQVGRGMSYEEDKTHFSMWCMLNSPLMAGNDLRTISAQTIEILTNKELIALNQDKLFYQARSILREGNIEIWEKLLSDKKKKAIAIMNRGESAAEYTLNARSVGLAGRSNMRDLWLHRSLGKIGKERKFTIPAHGIVVLEISI